MRLFRFLKILSIVIRYGLDEFLPKGFLRALIGGIFFWRAFAEPRGARLRQALEALGPIFVKFGQLLSTRPDLVPADPATAPSRLQDLGRRCPAAEAWSTPDHVYGSWCG